MSQFKLPSIGSLTLTQCKEVKKQIEKYLEILDIHIEVLDAPRIKKEEEEQDRKYLAQWFDHCFDEDERYNDMRVLFLKYCNPEHFMITRGYFIGKRSLYVNVLYSEWMPNVQLYSTEGGSWWHLDNGKEGDSLEEILGPLPKDEILKDFSELTEEDKNDKETMEAFIEETIIPRIYADSFRDLGNEIESGTWVDENYHFSDRDY